MKIFLMKMSNKLKDISLLMDGKVQHGKDVSSSQLNYRFSAVPIKILENLKKKINTLKKVIWKCKELRIANTILKWKNTVEELPLSDFETYYKVIVINTLVFANACWNFIIF